MRLPKFRLFATIRTLDRIYRELKRMNDLTEIRMNQSQPQWKRSGKPAKLAHVSAPSIAEWNKRYSDRHSTEYD